MPTSTLYQGRNFCGTDTHCVPEFVGETIDIALGHCFPLVEPPVDRGADCVSDPETCNDPCDSFSFCSPQIGADQGRVCVSACHSGDDYLPAIDGGCPADAFCVPPEPGTGDASLCWPKCNPLDSQCPQGAAACVQVSDHRMACLPYGYGTQELGQACGDMLACGEGTVCQAQADLGTSCASPSCCTELCDLTGGGDVCSTPEHVCLPYHLPGDTPAGSENLGWCGLPSAHPCLSHPGACPPAGIDQSYPWCSFVNTTACSQPGYYANYTNYDDFECTTMCSCVVPCEDVSDCPIPATGTAMPVCVESDLGPGNRCELPCAGETCPDGMTCGTGLDATCSWISPLAIPSCVH